MLLHIGIKLKPFCQEQNKIVQIVTFYILNWQVRRGMNVSTLEFRFSDLQGGNNENWFEKIEEFE